MGNMLTMIDCCGVKPTLQYCLIGYMYCLSDQIVKPTFIIMV